MAVAKKTGKPKASITKEKEKEYLCPYCNNTKKESDFYMSTDPLVLTGRTSMCRECAAKIALNYNEETGEYGECNKDSILETLERLDKPFFENLYESSIREVNNPDAGIKRKSVWDAYIKNISMGQYATLRWRDSDLFLSQPINRADDIKDQIDESQKEYRINKRDVIKALGYDPFENYPIKADKPILYAQLINFIDDETKNDAMKLNAVLQIVQAFNQIQKLNDAINALLSDTKRLNNNNGTIRQHADTISKLLGGANNLAKDNGISVNHNNSKSKGADTLTGKMRELDLIGFRAAKINMYDIDYCAGMRQVAEISAKAQIDQIGFDENAVNEINAIRRELVDSLQKERDKAVERARILLVENKDLKDFLRDKNLIDEYGVVVDNE